MVVFWICFQVSRIVFWLALGRVVGLGRCEGRVEGRSVGFVCFGRISKEWGHMYVMFRPMSPNGIMSWIPDGICSHPRRLATRLIQSMQYCAVDWE